MTAGSRGLPRAFRGALIVSAALHAALILLVVAGPSFSRPKPQGLVQYVNFIGTGGGPGGSGGAGGGGVTVPKPTPLPPAKKESLRDLTTALKAKPEDKATLHYPTEKPKTAKKTPEKKTAISKPAPAKAGTETATEAAAGQEGSQGGFGLRFGTGGGTGGAGTGPGGLGGGGTGGDPFGVSGFPFTYYLQIISDRISANWFNSLVDPGVSGQFQTQVGFRIYRNGQVADLKIEVPSGVEAFDLSAQRAIQSSAPFPPLPSEYDGQFLVIHLIFEHAK